MIFVSDSYHMSGLSAVFCWSYLLSFAKDNERGKEVVYGFAFWLFVHEG